MSFQAPCFCGDRVVAYDIDRTVYKDILTISIYLAYGTSHLGHVLLDGVVCFTTQVGCVCYMIKQIFHSSSKIRSDMVLGANITSYYAFM